MEYEIIEKKLVIFLPEEVDHHNCRTLQKDTEEILRNNDIRRIVFDFSRVLFMDSSGIGVILGRYKKMQSLGGDVAVCSPGKRIRRILRMSGIEKMAEIYETVGEAVQKGEEKK